MENTGLDMDLVKTIEELLRQASRHIGPADSPAVSSS